MCFELIGTGADPFSPQPVMLVDALLSMLLLTVRNKLLGVFFPGVIVLMGLCRVFFSRVKFTSRIFSQGWEGAFFVTISSPGTHIFGEC